MVFIGILNDEGQTAAGLLAGRDSKIILVNSPRPVLRSVTMRVHFWIPAGIEMHTITCPCPSMHRRGRVAMVSVALMLAGYNMGAFAADGCHDAGPASRRMACSRRLALRHSRAVGDAAGGREGAAVPAAVRGLMRLRGAGDSQKDETRSPLDPVRMNKALEKLDEMRADAEIVKKRKLDRER